MKLADLKKKKSKETKWETKTGKVTERKAMPHTLRGLKDFQLQNQTKTITLHKKKTVKEKSERD